MKRVLSTSILLGLALVATARPALRPERKQESGAAAKALGSETAVIDRAVRPVFGKQESGR